MRTSHAASKCSVLSVAHALDEVACSRVGLAEKPKDERSDAAERAETRDEGTEFTWYSMGEFHVELAELGFNLGEDGGGATLHSTRGIRTGSGRVLERVVLDGVQRLELEEVVGWFSAIERSLSLGVYFWGSFTVGGSREGEESCLAGLLSRLCKSRNSATPVAKYVSIVENILRTSTARPTPCLND